MSASSLPLWTTLALLTGSAATLLPAVLLATPCAASVGGTFAAPVITTGLIFLAGLSGLAFDVGLRACDGPPPPPPPPPPLPLPHALPPPPPPPPSLAASALALSWIALPGALNWLACSAQIAALLFVSAATLAGTRGVLILCTALASLALRLRDSPGARPAEWACIGATVAGAAAVGGAQLLQAAADARAPAGGAALGLGLCVLGYACAAGQFAAESWLLEAQTAKKQPAGVTYTKWLFLGVEGALGLALTAGALAALAAAGAGGGGGSALAEDPRHAWACLSRTPAVAFLALGYMTASFCFNATLMRLGDARGVQFRVFVFTARGLLTWAAETVLYYAAGGGGGDAGSPGNRYGLPLAPASALVLFGFALLIGGGIARLRLQQAAAAAAAIAPLPPPPEMAAPLLRSGGGDDDGDANE
jgi:hypothetical protein